MAMAEAQEAAAHQQIGMLILSAHRLVRGQCQRDNQRMFWNAIRNHIHYRLPGIIDFLLFAAAMTFVAAVLLGLVALYVEYGMFLFWVGVGAVCLAAILSERRRPVYTGGGGPWEAFGSSGPAPGKNALPPPGARQIGQVRRRELPGPKK
jgi:hypothetical protein